MRHYSPSNTEIDQAVTRAAKELADEIDWQILAETMLKAGWTEVQVDDYTQKYRDGMASWIFNNIRGNKTGMRGRWLFESPADATWFRLRWS